MIMKKCFRCKKPVPPGRQKYCSKECLLKSSRSNFLRVAREYRATPIIKPKLKRRKCNGVYCLGQKYFMSQGKFNQVCPHCTTVLRNTDDLGGDYRVRVR